MTTTVFPLLFSFRRCLDGLHKVVVVGVIAVTSWNRGTWSGDGMAGRAGMADR